MNTIKFKLLIIIARFLEILRLVSKTSGIFGTFNGEEFDLIKKLYNSGDDVTVIDVGANTGEWSEKVAQILVNNSIKFKLISVEPVPIFYQELTARNIPNCTTLKLGISNQAKSLIITRLGGGASVLFDKSDSHKDKEEILIKCTKGDQLVQKMKIKPNFIKVDADGLDFEILQSFLRTINESRPIVQFEHTFRFAKEMGYSLKDVIHFFNQFSYEVYVIDRDSNLRSIKLSRLEVLNHQTKNFLAFPSRDYKI